ncbi:MAG TPA: 30S ribosomal protein S6 [Patescibacteria group bacterium]|nr:30S ribosomal protein S6 [Patescibacteria group bacterium]
MRKYELTYLVSDEVREGDLNKVTGAVNGFITGLGGKIVKEDIWGRRKLAYPIKKADFATYVTLSFDLPADKAFELDRDIRQTTAIMRHLTIIKEHGHEAISLTAAEIAETAEIEEVIGGEKSFEAVEGMTEESRDLMAKREDKGDKEEIVDEIEDETPQLPQEIQPEPETPQIPEIPQEKLAEKKPAEEKKPVVKAKKTVEKTERPAVEKTEKVEKAKKEKKTEDEAERLSKLNDELDDILRDEL